MDYRTSLQHLLHKLLPSLGHADAPASANAFADTCLDDARPASPTALRRVASSRQPTGAWSETAIDLVLGTEIMEFPDDTAADLMHEYFDDATRKRAA